jgi:hypothetical protein
MAGISLTPEQANALPVELPLFDFSCRIASNF